MPKALTKRNFSIVLFWVISWTFLSNLFILYRFVGLNWAEEIFVLSSKEWYILFAQTTFIGLTGGLLFGLLDSYINHKNYLHRIPFGLIILLKSFGYFFIAIVVLFPGFYFAAILNQYSSQEAFKRAFDFYSSSYFIVLMGYLLVHMILLNFIRHVSEKFGPGNLIRLFFGRYYKPVEERRIFMFLDLKSSTEYAERLGHIRYSQLIQDCFIDITPVIENYEAQIYQYAGDEVILSWKCDSSGVYKNVVLLYFDFREKIRHRGDYYLNKYGFLPEFKAGINAGIITVAEVGVKKKEIAYHGDAINTTSRIQEQCNLHNQMLLCSEYFVNELSKSNHFRTIFIDEFVPRGKRIPVRIYSVEPPSNLPEQDSNAVLGL